MKTFDDVIRVFEENEDLCDFVGKIGVKVVEEAESVLGINFPISYSALVNIFWTQQIKN